MKKLLFILATSFIAFASCSKPDNNNVTPSLKVTDAPTQVDGKHINAPVQVGVTQPMR